MKLKTVEIKSIDRSNRSRVDYGEMLVLMKDIEEHGLIQPLAVAELPAGCTHPYRLLAGDRRLTACVRLGHTEVPVRVYDEGLSEQEMKSIELAENLCRKDLSWAEELKMKKEINVLLKDIHGEKIGLIGHSDADTASMLGEHKSTLSRDLQLAELIETMPELANLKTKEDARKVLKTIGKTHIRKEKMRVIEEVRGGTAIDILRKNLADSYIVGDARQIADLPDKSVKYIDLDPPFGITLDKWKKLDGPRTSMEEYNEVDAKEYKELMDFMIPQCARVIGDDGWITVWFAPDPWFHTVNVLLATNKFRYLAVPCIWTKGTGQTNSPKLYLGSSYESFFLARRDRSELVRQGRSNDFRYNPIPPLQKRHPTEKPVELMQDILSLVCEPGDKILVPFLGSGNTLLAGANLGLSGTGWDLSEDNKNSFAIEVHESEPGKYRSYK